MCHSKLALIPQAQGGKQLFSLCLLQWFQGVSEWVSEVPAGVSSGYGASSREKTRAPRRWRNAKMPPWNNFYTSASPWAHRNVTARHWFMIKRPWSSLKFNNNNLHNQRLSKYTVPPLEARIRPFCVHIYVDVLHYWTKNYQNRKQPCKHTDERQIN